MEKTIEFKIPEGYVFDKDNSTDEVIRFKRKKITYEDIIQKLKAKSMGICIKHDTITIGLEFFITNENQLEQLLALNKLMNVAKYLNGDWKPDWKNRQQYKYCCYFDNSKNKISITRWTNSSYGRVHFKSDEVALQAIEILGEDEVKKALGIFE